MYTKTSCNDDDDDEGLENLFLSIFISFKSFFYILMFSNIILDMTMKITNNFKKNNKYTLLNKSVINIPPMNLWCEIYKCQFFSLPITPGLNIA